MFPIPGSRGFLTGFGTVVATSVTAATVTATTSVTTAALTATGTTTLAGATISSTTVPLSIDTGVNEDSYFSPTEITSNQTDWNISTPHSANRFNRYIITSDASRTINSIAFNVTSRHAYWIVNGNTTAGRNITLLHDDGATGTAANRFYCPNQANVVVRPGGAVFVWYDTGVSRHRVMGA